MARGATNSKCRVIHVDAFKDIDDPSAVGGELPPPGRGANTTLPAFLRPEVLSLSMRSSQTTTVSQTVQLRNDHE